jgi:hypothetical protein
MSRVRIVKFYVILIFSMVSCYHSCAVLTVFPDYILVQPVLIYLFVLHDIESFISRGLE